MVGSELARTLRSQSKFPPEDSAQSKGEDRWAGALLVSQLITDALPSNQVSLHQALGKRA